MSGSSGNLQYDLVTGDTAAQFKMTCKDRSTGLVLDLTGCTAALHWIDGTGATVTRAMTIDAVPTTGIVSYVFATGEIFGPEMIFEVEILNSGGKKLTSTETTRLRVRTQLA